jgi:hypothetical protein
MPAFSFDVNLMVPFRGASPEVQLETLKRAHATQMSVYSAVPSLAAHDAIPVCVHELRETSPGIWRVQMVEIPVD